MNREIYKKIIRESIVRNWGQCFCLILLEALTAMVMLVGIVLGSGNQKGLQQVRQRFGADLLVVSNDSDIDVKDIFLNVLDSHEYLSKDYVEKIAELDGVEQVSGQFFFASLGSGCCDVKVNIIGIDEESDFTIRPWITKRFGNEIEEGALYVGYDVLEEGCDGIQLFGKQYKVAGILDATGSNLDKSVFGTMECVSDIKHQAESKGFTFPEKYQDETLISAIYIKVNKGHSVDTLAKEINKLGGLRVIQMQSMVASLGASVESGARAYKFVLGILLIFAIGAEFGIYHFVSATKRKELYKYKLIGMDKKDRIGVYVGENCILSLAGTLCGLVLGFIIIWIFQTHLMNYLELPYVSPGIEVWVIGVLAAVAITFLPGPVILSIKLEEEKCN